MTTKTKRISLPADSADHARFAELCAAITASRKAYKDAKKAADKEAAVVARRILDGSWRERELLILKNGGTTPYLKLKAEAEAAIAVVGESALVVAEAASVVQEAPVVEAAPKPAKKPAAKKAAK